jgi:hypothetical protein
MSPYPWSSVITRITFGFFLLAEEHLIIPRLEKRDKEPAETVAVPRFFKNFLLV